MGLQSLGRSMANLHSSRDRPLIFAYNCSSKHTSRLLGSQGQSHRLYIALCARQRDISLDYLLIIL